MRLQCRLMLGRVLHQPLKTFFYSTKCFTIMIFAPVLAPALCPYSMSVSRRTRTHTHTQKYAKTKF